MENLPKSRLFPSRYAWRQWLKKNHNKRTEIWIAYYKKHAKGVSVSYDEAVEEAICFGWIDGKVRRIDDRRFMQKYTPRGPKSAWSLLNKNRALKMIKQRKITKAGLAKIEAAKKAGLWDTAYTSLKKTRIPSDLGQALKKDKLAYENFHRFSNSNRNMNVGWVIDAKKPETRMRRIKEVVYRASQNVKAGIAWSLPEK